MKEMDEWSTTWTDRAKYACKERSALNLLFQISGS